MAKDKKDVIKTKDTKKKGKRDDKQDEKALEFSRS